jgi:hypothetical protein
MVLDPDKLKPKILRAHEAEFNKLYCTGSIRNRTFKKAFYAEIIGPE